MQIVIVVVHALFLSTLSLRRATYLGAGKSCDVCDFYPRSPCGERPRAANCQQRNHHISIHALLAESDLGQSLVWVPGHYFYPRSPCGERPIFAVRPYDAPIFLSTLSLRRATPAPVPCSPHAHISIHALLAESDHQQKSGNRKAYVDFYPRSPCGERRYSGHPEPGGNLGFLSTLSLRRATIFAVRPYDAPIFLSTLSLRRATSTTGAVKKAEKISIHALLAESDRWNP